MDQKLDMATLLKEELQRRFPTDTITTGYGEIWWAVYVNGICYVGGIKDEQFFTMLRPGGTTLEGYQVHVSYHDPELFEKVKAMTLRNMVYYEQNAKTDRSGNS